MHLGGPIVDLVPTPDGAGYYLIGADGGVFTFGDAHFFGSAVPSHPASSVVAMTLVPDGSGYWLATGSGQVIPFGSAQLGTTDGTPPTEPIIGIFATTTGYVLIDAAGGTHSFVG